jgi:hypothetical protein
MQQDSRAALSAEGVTQRQRKPELRTSTLASGLAKPKWCQGEME